MISHFFLCLLPLMALLTGCTVTGSNTTQSGTSVKVIRTPDGGIVPETMLDRRGVVHLVYGKGKDGFYVNSSDGGKTFSKPVQLNRQAGTVTVGGERGPKIAIGKDNSVHIVWLGDYQKGGGIWYTQSTDGGHTFQPERNLLDTKTGTDGATIASDQEGNVFVLWLDGRLPEDPESPFTSPIFMSVSKDNGVTFSSNQPLKYEPIRRACACCRLEAQVSNDGYLYIAFRTGYQSIRDIYLLSGRIKGENNFQPVQVSVDNWKLDACPMSGSSFYVTDTGPAVISWMSDGKVYWSASKSSTEKLFLQRISTPERKGLENHPTILTNRKGEVMLIWNQGSKVNWAEFNMEGKFSGSQGVAGTMNGSSKSEAFVSADGDFYIVL